MHPPPRLGRLEQINVNPHGGVPKHRVAQAVVTVDGVAGDRQRNRRYHGGPSRAVSLFAHERIAALAAAGHPIAPGSTGENLTVSGLAWSALAPGDRVRVGEVVLELTAFAPPCKTIRGSFLDDDASPVSQKRHPGWSRLYARVLTPGTVREGDAVEHAPAPRAAP